MKKSLVIAEQDNIGAILENERVVEFFVNRGELLLGDIYTASVENILPGIDAAFVNLGKDKMGFLHANDVPGQGPLKERLVPKQKLLVQITKEPTGHKGPRVSTAISLPGRFLVLVPEERGVSISRRISEARERARLKSVVNLMKPPGVGLIIRTEAKGQGENELFEDFEQLWDRWQTVVSDGEASIGPTLIYRDQDLLYRVIRDAYSHDVVEIIVDSPDGQKRAQEYLSGWAGRQTRISYHQGEESLLVAKGIDKEIEAALSDRVELPSGGHLNIQPTEALTVIDVNSGKFTSSRTQAETVRRTNLEAAQEISRQLRLRNIGGMVIVDFIDMDSRKDQQQVLEVFQRTLEEDRAKPQVGQLSDLGLVELTRRRQGQSLRELFTIACQSCSGLGVVPTLELGPAEHRRVITFKSREEEALGKGRNLARKGAKQQAAVLRAATAINGRIVPTVEDAPEFDEAMAPIPEHILEQMPDELLNGTAATGKRAGVFDDQANGESDTEQAEHEEELSFEPASQAFARQNYHQEKSFTEPPESNKFEDLAESVLQIDEELREFDSTRTSGAEPVQRVREADFTEAGNADLEAPTSQSVASQPTWEMEQKSPFETEIDPVTGIYRLKNKVHSLDVAETKEESQPVNFDETDSEGESEQSGATEAASNQPTWHSDSPDHTESTADDANVATEQENVIVLPASQEPENNDSNYQQLKLSSVNDQGEEQKD
ncbi:MAG: ribonuclease E/G [Candidatus Melainabacteria bacterium]|nr:MAG: ribonuclease E/G [Candidatus Melainabacteria bacterium]